MLSAKTKGDLGREWGVLKEKIGGGRVKTDG